MVAAPTLPAMANDILWCLGLGLLLAMLRDALGLALGNGRLLCFVWDVSSFALAAVLLCGFSAGISASGIVRWYMAAGMGTGVLAWRWALQDTVHVLARGCLHLAALPFQLVSHKILGPVRRICKKRMKSVLTLHRKARKSSEKEAKKGKKQLQNAGIILYN